MKNSLLLLILILFGCESSEKDALSQKKWLGQPVDFSSIRPIVNTYHMFDSTNTKVGSMIFGTYFENGKVISRDTSSFDDGRLYEEASFTLDTTNFDLTGVSIEMQINRTKLSVELRANDNQVNGLYQIIRDTVVSDYPVDSLYTYDVVRGELYMLMQSLEYKKGDTINFKALVSTSMTVSDASLYYVKEEQTTTAAGTFDCTVIYLMTDGKMPQNRIWITKEKPAKIVKFEVPGAQLSIELVSSI